MSNSTNSPESKKTDLVKQQLDRIRQVRPTQGGSGVKGKSSSGPAGAGGLGKNGADAAANQVDARQVDEHHNRDAAARKGAPRDPVTLGAAVEGLIQANDWSKKAELATVMASWQEIIGPEFAEHVKPIGFDENESILILQADSTSWATQTRLLLVEILRKIDDTVGSQVVKSLEIKGPEPVRKARGRYRVKGRGPRDTYG